MYTQAPCIVSLGGSPSVSVKKWFEALTTICSLIYFRTESVKYNLNYNLRPLRGPSIILICTQYAKVSVNIKSAA